MLWFTGLGMFGGGVSYSIKLHVKIYMPNF